MRLTTVLDRYVVQLQADGRSPHTIRQAERHVRLLARWLAAARLPTDVRKVTHEHVAKFLVSPAATCRPDGQPKKATATNSLRSSVRMLFRYAHGAGYAPRNAAALVRRARCATPPPRALPPEDCKRLLATIAKATGDDAERDHVLFALLLGTGLRIGTALALERRDVDLRAGEMTLRTMKNDAPDRIALPRGIVRQLRAYLRGRGEGALFTGHRDRPMTTRHAHRRLRRWLREAGVERRVGPHALRHSYAMGLYRRTRDIAAVQAALLHRSIQSSAAYARAGHYSARQ